MTSTIDIHRVRQFISEQDCAALVGMFRANDNSGDPFWGGRLMFNVNWPSSVRAALESVDALASRLIGRDLRLINAHLVCWPSGSSGMPPHDDHGGRGEFPHREYAGIVRLNDGYTGGETTFPDLGIGYKEPIGDLLIYPGGSMRHGVTPVSGDNRYTLPFWFASKDVYPLAPERSGL